MDPYFVINIRCNFVYALILSHAQPKFTRINPDLQTLNSHLSSTGIAYLYAFQIQLKAQRKALERFLYFIILIYFAFGAVLMSIINRRKSKEARKQNWTKYLTYLLLVNALFISILINATLFRWIIGLVVLLGLYEIVHHVRDQKRYTLGIALLAVYLPLGYLLLRFTTLPERYIFFTLMIVTVFDAFSQLTGQLFGRTKIVPNISPNKTYAGLMGGMLAAILTAVWIRDLIHFTPLQSALLALAMALSAFGGDLLASLAKRKLGIKDYSKLLPGHGGVLDRFDSLFLAGSFAWVFAKYIYHVV